MKPSRAAWGSRAGRPCLTALACFVSKGVQGRRDRLPHLRPAAEHGLSLPRVRLPPVPGHVAGAQRPLQPLGGVRASAQRPRAAGGAGQRPRPQGQGHGAHGRTVRRPHRAWLRQPLHHLRLYITILLHEVEHPAGSLKTTTGLTNATHYNPRIYSDIPPCFPRPPLFFFFFVFLNPSFYRAFLYTALVFYGSSLKKDKSVF